MDEAGQNAVWNLKAGDCVALFGRGGGVTATPYRYAKVERVTATQVLVDGKRYYRARGNRCDRDAGGHIKPCTHEEYEAYLAEQKASARRIEAQQAAQQDREQRPEYKLARSIQWHVENEFEALEGLGIEALQRIAKELGI